MRLELVWIEKAFNNTVSLFGGVLKWAALALMVGAIVGLSTTLFQWTLNQSMGISAQNSQYYLLLPIALFLNALIAQYISPKADAFTANKVIESIHQMKKIPALSIPKAFFLPVLTIASGGSAGKETPAADVGAGLGSLLSDVLFLSEADRKTLMICGLSSGFAAIFGTPIAGAIFGVEVLFAAGMMYEALLPSMIAGITAFYVSSSLGMMYFYHPITFVPPFNLFFILEMVLAGIFFGIVATFFIEVMKMGQRISAKIKIWEPFKAIIAGLTLIGLTMLFSTHYLGLGMDTIASAINGDKIEWYMFLLKSVFTSITLNFGGNGGTVTPVFFVGSTAGNAFAQFLGLDREIFSAIGLVAVLAGVTNTPIAASILAIKLFGSEVAPYASIACVISFVITGRRSIYSSQILAIKNIYRQKPSDDKLEREL